MSGGFFRGTSADQDTRFSNKMSKLLKSQKFAPELDVLVEMAKVKIDVIKPWIATRVTELLGFEDEVLINFIYGLLDVKEADGKHLQIQLTGFMEKNTGRFMKELWGLLTSAQSNMSGVPQQFLDAKAEEAKKKKDEKDRIFSEVRRKKEEQEKDAEEERQRRLSAREESSKANLEKRRTSVSPGRGFDRKSSEGFGGAGGRNGRGARRTSISPRRSRSPSSSTSRGSPPIRRRHPHARSISRSPRRRRRSISPFRRRSPLQRYSPLPLRSPPRRRRSPLDSRSPPRRRKSPMGRTPPLRIRSRSPLRNSRRSPTNLRSPPRRQMGPRSPPLWRRSASGSVSPPIVRRSPSRSPYTRRRSPSRDRVARRSPPKRRRSMSREQGFRRSRSPYQRRRSPSRELGGPQIRSPYRNRRSPSRERAGRRNGFDPRDRDRLARESDRSERRSDHPEKRDIPGQRPSLSRERDGVASKEGHDTRPSEAHISGDKRLHRELEERVDLEPVTRERSGQRDVDVARVSGKSISRPQRPDDHTIGRSDEMNQSGERKEMPAKVASESEDEDFQAPRPQIVVKRVKDVADAGGDEDISDSAGSSDERRAAKRRRKEEKRLRKEERRKKREEKHRRKEEKRAAKATNAAVDVDENGKDNMQREDDNHHGPRDAFGSVEVYRSKDDESEDEQKRIERELRNKALESLRAKKGIAC